jgi:hypothetical protein
LFTIDQMPIFINKKYDVHFGSVKLIKQGSETLINCYKGALNLWSAQRSRQAARWRVQRMANSASYRGIDGYPFLPRCQAKSRTSPRMFGLSDWRQVDRAVGLQPAHKGLHRQSPDYRRSWPHCPNPRTARVRLLNSLSECSTSNGSRDRYSKAFLREGTSQHCHTSSRITVVMTCLSPG